MSVNQVNVSFIKNIRDENFKKKKKLSQILIYESKLIQIKYTKIY